MKTEKDKSEIDDFTFDDKEESKISNTASSKKLKNSLQGSQKESELKEMKATIPESIEFQTFNGYKVKFRKMFTEEKDKERSENIYNGVELIVDNSFGCSNINIEKNGLFISEVTQTIIYPSGNHLV